MGLVSSLYPKYSTSFLTDQLAETVGLSGKGANSYQPINSMVFEWDVDVKFVKKLAFSANCIGDGKHGQNITAYFGERYYEKYDVFQILASKQQFMVLMVPESRSDNLWEYTCQLIDSTQTQSLTSINAQRGTMTRFLYNTQPELHDKGYMKYQSNIEKHVNYLSEIRHDDSQSARYAVLEQTLIDVEMDIKSPKTNKLVTVKETLSYPTYASELIKAFLQTRATKSLVSKSSMDANGKCTLHDPIGNRDLIQGDGIIPQIERFASIYNYQFATVGMLNKGISMLSKKAETPMGNTFYFTANHILYEEMQTVLIGMADSWHQLQNIEIKRHAGKIVVGDTFTGYTFMGNTIIFSLDSALTLEYEDSGYGIMLDITPNKEKNKPAIQSFTLKGKGGNADMVYGELNGFGGQNGVTSGTVSTKLSASSKMISGYSGIGMLTPYRAFIFKQNTQL